MIGLFHERHSEEYGHARLAEEPEITGLRLLVSADVPKPAFSGGFTKQRTSAVAAGSRRANLGAGFAETSIYHGPDLEPGHTIPGPAIVEETFTTIVVYPGWQARVDGAGDYVLERA